ncbi:MAG: DUF4387 domain-containing protein [Devosiaceae bacterium]|nr:DUF4387 domain-containing protein [Devosiaceae bacterium]
MKKVRSKNAGPFWLTMDIFCNSKSDYQHICSHLKTQQIAAVFSLDITTIKRFNIASLNVVKFSFPRPFVQGSIHDPDMHGASWAALLAEVEIDDLAGGN